MAEDAFPISGSIDEKAFPFLLMDLQRQEATGSLKVDGPAYQKALYFRGGRILFGSSNDPKDQLGAILIESGKINPEQLEDVNAKVGPGSPLAKVLAESGFVNQRELSEAARAKVERILADVLSYDSGSFEFEDGVLPKGAVDLKLATDKLVLAAVRRIGERSFVLRHIGSLETVLTLIPGATERLAEVEAESEHLGNYLDGRRTLKAAAAAAHLDEFEAAKVACAFLFLGLARAGEESSPAIVSEPEASGFAIVEGSELDLGQRGGAPPHESYSEPLEEPAVPGASSGEEEERDPLSFAPSPEVSTSDTVTGETERRKRSIEPETLFIEPPAAKGPEKSLPLAPPRRTSASDTKPPAPTDIHLPSLGDAGFEAAGDGAETIPKSRPPSREDLAALDALLNSNSLEGPLTPLEKPTEARFDSRLGAGPRPRGRRSEGGGGRRALSLVAALVLLLGVGGVVWYEYFPQTPVKVAAAPATTVPATTLPNPTTTIPAPEPSKETPVPAKSPAAPPTTTVATTLPPPPTTTLPQRPAPQPRGTAGAGDSIQEARTAMERGDFSRAANAFAGQLRKAERGSFSIQLMIACSEETIAKAAQNVASRELFIVPVDYKGRSCYRMCWGIYESEAAARNAAASIPEYFHKGGASPKAVSALSILP